jgi:diguanylate cyclase (GGDEF)-like protein
MKVSRNKLRRNWFYTLLVLIIGVISVGINVAYNGIKSSNEYSGEFENYYFDEKKEMAKLEVENRVDEINYELQNIQQSQQKLIKEKILYVEWLLKQQNLLAISDEKERNDATIKVLNNVTAYDSDYTYFAITVEGVLLKSGTNAELEGLNLYNVQDTNGVYYIREMIKAVDTEEGVYVTYKWPKEKYGEALEKTSYCLYLPELDIIIGTGIYDVDVQEALKEVIYKRFQSYYEDSDEYIFLADFDSTVRVTGDKNSIGEKLNEVYDTNGQTVHDLLMDTIKEEGEGFVTYSYYKKNSSQVATKTSYVKSIDEWGAYIGMGFYIDDLNVAIEKYADEYRKDSYVEIFSALLGLIVIMLLVYTLIKRGIHLQTQYMQQEEMVFTEFLRLSNEAIFVITTSGKVLYKNAIAKKMIGNNIESYFNGTRVEFEKVKEKTYRISNQKGRKYYVEIKVDEIIYQGYESLIYFIKDITKQFLETHEFEKMALIDELSGLPNRRKLNNDFEDICFNKNGMVNVVITMIDLDQFKTINDTYGHDVGDRVIQLLAKTFNARLRQSDTIYRYGGEEFVVILHDISLEDSIKILEDINNNFSRLSVSEVGISSTFSGGAVLIDWQEEEYSLQNILKISDQLLYQAKSMGRSRIETQLNQE